MVVQIANLKDARLRILTKARRRNLPRRITESDADLAEYSELIETGFLDGWITVGVHGQPVKVAGMKITIKGEEFLEEHDDFQLSSSVFTSNNFSLLGCLACYLLVLGLFVVVLNRSATASAPEVAQQKGFAPANPQKSTEPILLQEPLTKKSFSMGTFGVCGLPPLD